jgi:nitric oxide reductase subunit B
MAIFAYQMMRRSGLAHPNSVALHWTIGATVFSALGAGILGFAHTWPGVNQWTHGTHVTTMHGHMAFFGAYAMIVLALVSYALPLLSGTEEPARQTRLAYFAFWFMVAGMFGMTMALAAAGITQTYLERILGLGYIETQQKIQVHYLMWLATAVVFGLGVLAYLADFARAFARPGAPALRVAGR